MQEYLEIGQIVNTFGVKGMVKVNPFTDDITRFDKLKKVYICKKASMEEVEIEEVKYHKNMVLLKIKGINDMNQAEKCKGLYLKIHRKDAIKLPKDTYFIADLLGLEVYTDEGVLLGKVDDIYNTGSNDIYVVKDDLGKQILLPGTKEVLKEISLEKEKIVVHLIKGLI
ncbi:MAG: ribosome maturation factor RimM [Clostridia bacterium]|jgi:16S rRNA processing protein RimM|nr:ribosome maturation factor RimM [Clostridium sp. CAG:571]HJJ07673.1 ribosome maturation factor RimM [Clostridiaceae bacterium]HJJ14505.1 ribosome maturation factor RimM [Clostridiaceae bacterium]